MTDKYADLDMDHKRKILAANRTATTALNYLRAKGSNDLAKLFTKNAVLYANKLSEDEVEKQIAELDHVVEESRKKERFLDEFSARRKTRSLFR